MPRFVLVWCAIAEGGVHTAVVLNRFQGVRQVRDYVL